MQIIQKIRDKGAAIVIAVISLSLIGFILMDANLGLSRNSGGERGTYGKVNGQKINAEEFDAKVKMFEEQSGGRAQANQARQNAWDQLVYEKVAETEFNKLGITFSPKELTAIMFSDDAPYSLKQAFTNKETNEYDLAKVQEWWSNAKKFKGEQREAIETQVVDPIRMQAMYAKYSGMIAASGYYPNWMKEKEATEAKTFANISYVAVPYSAISDSTVKVSDDDIINYMGKHKAAYQQDGGRLISYVSFSSNPSAADTAATFQAVAGLKDAFAADTTPTPQAFLSKNSTSRDYKDIWVLKSKINGTQKDTLASLATNAVYGPYFDGKDFVVAKKIAARQLPDTVKCRHILIGTVDPQTGAAKLSDSAAKTRIDSIETAVRGGADFAALVTKYSDDQGSKEKGGEYTIPYYNPNQQEMSFATLAKEFGEVAFFGNTGDKKVVKTSFGYHYIEVLSQYNFEPAYKIAYMAKDILPSDETIRLATGAASKLSAEARNRKAFDEYVAKNKLQKIESPAIIKENDYAIGGLQDARQIIKWAFDAKEGDVSEPYTMNDQFVVGVVTKVVPQGLPDAKTARPAVEALVKNSKKAELIKTKLTATPTLESAAKSYPGLAVATAGADSTLVFSSSIINGVGTEPKVIGAAFNKAYQAKASEAIEGTNGVYVIKVNSLGTKTVDVPATDKAKTMAQQLSYGWFESLKKLADIKDDRSKFF